MPAKKVKRINMSAAKKQDKAAARRGGTKPRGPMTLNDYLMQGKQPPKVGPKPPHASDIDMSKLRRSARRTNRGR